MALHRLIAASPGVTSITVDDVTLELDGAPVDVTNSQVERLNAVPGVRLKNSTPKPSTSKDS